MIRLYYKLLTASIKSSTTHRASFVMITSAYFLSTFTDIIGIWVLFDRFKIIQGWTLPELMIIYGIVHMGYSLAIVFAHGFDEFSTMIYNGNFDRVLLRPTSSLIQVATHKTQILKLGRFIQGFIILALGCTKLKLALFSFDALVLLFATVGTTCLFYGLLIIQATLTFWTTETLDIMDITTHGGMEAGQYPMTIYSRPFRFFFTFVVPVACVAYYPVATLLRHKTDALFMGTCAPMTGILFLCFACYIWSFGVKHYHSTGS